MNLREILTEAPVISSWISDLEFENNNVIMILGNGKEYIVKNVTFPLYQKWFNSSSKGSFWHKNIAGTYDVRRIA